MLCLGELDEFMTAITAYSYFSLTSRYTQLGLALWAFVVTVGAFVPLEQAFYALLKLEVL